MAQSLFSSYIILVGIVLITFNTGLLFIQAILQLLLLLVYFFWTLFKITCKSFITYPLTIFSLIYLFHKYRTNPSAWSKNLLYTVIVNIFGVDRECAICLEQEKVDKVLFTCGHFYHKKCIDSWISGHQQCPMCRRHFSKFWLQETQKVSLRLLKCLVKMNYQKILTVSVIVLAIYFSYCNWLTALGLGGDVIQASQTSEGSINVTKIKDQQL